IVSLFFILRRPPRSTLFPSRRSSDLDAVYFLYTHNRRADAQQWMNYLVAKYPDALIYDVRGEMKTPQKIADMTVEDYCAARVTRSEEHTSELQSRFDLVCRLLLEKQK